MNLKQALARIEELERRVAALEAAPKQDVHYHYQMPAPYQQHFDTVPPPVWTQPPVFWSPDPQPPPVWPSPQVTWCVTGNQW